MNIPPDVSDECSDALVELAFLALPSMEEGEMAHLLGAILRIVAREIRRAVTEERRKQRELIEKVSKQ